MKTPQLILNQHLNGVEISEMNDAVLKAMEEYKNQHKCKYCGVLTTQDDEQCYKSPNNDKM